MQLKFIISGGGTGGHIFPAVAVARELRSMHPDCSILFIGANGRMEMEKIPREGFEIIGLNVSGLKRSLSPANFRVFFQFIGSYSKAKRIIKEFKPDCVLGTGGYASLAVLYAATGLHIPSVIWEGNGFAGLTNRILGKRVSKVCTGLPGMEKFFPAEKIVYTGNPVRTEILNLPPKPDSIQFFGFNPDKKILFITGGSLGARTINQSIQNGLEQLSAAGIQVIWQTGKHFTPVAVDSPYIRVFQFLAEMDQAYAAADLVVSRAGALSIAEIAACGKASVLVPSPNVTDDHQTKNALKLTERNAAILVKDADAGATLVKRCIELLSDQNKISEIEAKVKEMAMPDATKKIAGEMLKLCRK